MAKQPFISHVVNGYSRYDVPENKAFSCTPGPLYPVRIDFINARDRVSLEQGIDVRSNPLAVPTFNPYVVRLHRFWVPLQLYHPEMRTNSSKFDMNNLSLNWIPSSRSEDFSPSTGNSSYTNSLMFWLRIGNKSLRRGPALDISVVDLDPKAVPGQWVNADTYLAYWDIVRNYYGYSQWDLYSFAWPASWKFYQSMVLDTQHTFEYEFSSARRFFYQAFGKLSFLDAFYESQFYPGSVGSTNGTFNRSNLFATIVNSDLDSDPTQSSSDGYPVFRVQDFASSSLDGLTPQNQFDISGADSVISDPFFLPFLVAHPLAVVPSNPDRFSRLVPVSSAQDVPMTGITSIPQLAVASRLQEYKDLLGGGGNRFSDWIATFFASKIDHVDTPKLLFSASQVINVQVILNQAGNNNFSVGNPPLGQQGGAIAFNSKLGRKQSYYFSEPGYLIDMLSIRPVYYWSAITPDYLDYRGSDYFNPLYNDIGYQDVPLHRVFNPNLTSASDDISVALEPCFNEFRASYDEVLGQLSAVAGSSDQPPLYSYWVQQRTLRSYSSVAQGRTYYYPSLFVEMSKVNSPFASFSEDNFFVNMSYSVIKKNLVNKTFATRLSNR
ncbi:major capsid protein [Dipodfec virus UOA04_Rod_653]|nr:major capsid protein [Dipodfec virus UOA04_Rod_653]